MNLLKNNILKIAMSLVLIVVFNNWATAQEKESATAFLKDYYRISGFGQYTNNRAGTVSKEDPTVNYDVLSNITAQYGLLINVYQTNRWNFKTGIILKPLIFSLGLNFTKEQTGFDIDIPYSTHLSGDDTIWSLPLVAEYIIPLNNRIKWMVAPSFTISNYRYFGGNELNRRRASIFTTFDDRSSKPIHTSAELSTGFYVLFKYFMLQPELRYSKSFNTIKSGSFTTENFLTVPDGSKGSYKISGDYWGFSLNIYIKKFGKNKKRNKRSKKLNKH
jgi:hypothetical protein